MRYWKPFTEEVMQQIKKDEINEVVLLPLYPQFSKSTTGSSVKEWNRLAEKYPYVKKLKTSVIERYYDYIPYIDSIVERINQTLEKFPKDELNNVHIMFSAHGTPMKLVREGDPYRQEIIKTVVAVMERGKFPQKHHLSYQSKVGPQKWLEPKTPDVIEKLAGEGVKYMLIVPIAFVSDHLETLFEIGVEFRHLARGKGIEQFEVMEGLNDSPKFITALKELVLDRVK